MSLFAANLNLALSRARDALRAEPRILSAAAALAVVLLLLQWAPQVGGWLLTGGFRHPAPELLPAPYVVAMLLIQLAYAYGLAFLLAGVAGYLVERHRGAPLQSPHRGVERYGLRYAHQLLAMFIAVNLLLSLLVFMIMAPGMPAEGAAVAPQRLHGGGTVLAVLLQLGAELYLLLWTLELVRGRGWTKAGFAAAADGFKRSEVLLVGLGYFAFEIIAVIATSFVFGPAAVATPVTGLPFALLLTLARAVLLPLVILLLIQWQPEELAAALPEAVPVKLLPAESAPAAAAEKTSRKPRKRR